MNLKKTVLLEEHIKLGAKRAPFAGYDMPLQYTSVKEEVLAVRQDCGVFDVSHMCEFMLEGKDAVDFVDYLITNDFKSAPVGKAVYSVLCNNEGRALDDLIAYKLSEQKVLICANASNHQKDWNWISSQVSNYNLKLTDVSNQTALLAVQGPKSMEKLKTIGLANLESKEYYSVTETKYKNHPIIAARTGYTGEDGFEIFCPAEIAITLWTELLELGVVPCGLAARDVLRLEAAFPLYGHELSEELTPLDANLKWVVKLNKDNFIGKSSLLKYEPKKKLVKLCLDKAIPREGYVVMDSLQKEIGTVTSGTHSVMLSKGIAFALIETKLFPEDKIFYINIRGKNYKAEYQTKAFVSGSHK
jgi:aminomethyltransferase